MTSTPENSSAKRTFCDIVDGLSLPKTADAIIVLRNWDISLTQRRFDRALNLMQRKYAPLMLMSYDDSTKTEADRMFRLCMENMWDSIILVTHKLHSYRALLTFIKAFDPSGSCVDIHISKVGSRRSQEEFDKIEQYQAKGDIATYEEGIEYLKWINHGNER